MFRPASRALLRAPSVPIRAPASRRLINTSAQTEKPRSWRNTALRLGLAVGAVYYYNTSGVFERPLLSSNPPTKTPSDDSSLPTLDSITPRIRHERATSKPAPSSKPDSVPESQAQAQGPTPTTPSDENAPMKSPEALEEEAGQEAAFDPETGEINWDCPCLGGMAHGPCGEEFKAAFSCFVYSKEEPKGMDCIEKFKGMQDCFRQHPDVYGAELEDDEEAPPAEDAAKSNEALAAAEIDASSHPEEKRSQAKEVKSQMRASADTTGEQAEGEELIPKAWHDTEDKNADTKAARAEK